MKTYILILALIFTANSGLTQELTQTQKLSSLCKVWGFLKYYHPEVAKGKWDWDSVLIKKIPLVEATHNKEELSKVYTDWLSELGNISKYPEQADVHTATPKNKYLQWLNDESVFTRDLSVALENVRKRRDKESNYYVSGTFKKNSGNANFTNEKEYPELTYPEMPIRILTLFRHWNMVEYFFPYKYLIDKNWETVLSDMIPIFYNANDALSYHLAVAQVATELNDCHSITRTGEFRKEYSYGVPFNITVIDKKAIVWGIIKDSLCKLNDIRHGDIIISINDTPVMDKLERLKPYVSHSNYPTLIRNASPLLAAGNTNSVKITFERNGKTETKNIYRYQNDTLLSWMLNTDTAKFKILDDNIGYVNMGLLQELDVHYCMKAMENTSALILDVRNYPNGTMYGICNALSENSRPFVSFTEPDYSCPGAFRSERGYNCGRKNKRPYKGKIVVLHNELTQSHAEFTCMSFKTLQNTTLIGSQTAGADGNVSPIILPGGIRTRITGLGIYYPDGSETQRIGIVPDIEVRPTIEGIRAGRDEVLERAIAFINTGK